MLRTTKKKAPVPMDRDRIVATVDINNDAELARLKTLHSEMVEQRRVLLARFQGQSHPGAFGPQLRFDSSEDAAAILDGTPISTLESPQAQSDYASLTRKFRAAEASIPLIEQRRQERYMQLCLSEIERLRPVLRDAYGRVLDAWEGLLFELREYHSLITGLQGKGLYGGVLTSFLLTPREDGLLHGGMNGPNIETFLKIRREAVGLSIEGK